MLARFVARQLSHPSGLIGAQVLPRLWNRRNRALKDVAFDALELQPDDRVLEVGFGGGYLLHRMAVVVNQGLLAGVDASRVMVDYAKKRDLPHLGSIEVCCACAENLPYRARYFTKVCSVNSLFYWSDIEGALSELARVLAVGGRLVLCFTCAESLQGKGFTRHGVMLHEDDAVEEFLEAAGLLVTRRTCGSDRYREFLCLTASREL